jgi:voltage-gated potassium channel Kch
LDQTTISHVVIDHNPELVDQLESRRGEYVFADASSMEVYKHFFHEELKMVISTIRDLEDDLFIIQQIQEYNPDIIIVVFANRKDRVLQLYEAGADYVVMTETL